MCRASAVGSGCVTAKQVSYNSEYRYIFLTIIRLVIVLRQDDGCRNRITVGFPTITVKFHLQIIPLINIYRS